MLGVNDEGKVTISAPSAVAARGRSGPVDSLGRLAARLRQGSLACAQPNGCSAAKQGQSESRAASRREDLMDQQARGNGLRRES